MKVDLDDCIALNKKYPDTFLIPSKEEIDALCIGDCVKLVFINREVGNSERMWVGIKELPDPDGIFVGSLDNDPVCCTKLKHKDIIKFEAKHIAAIWS